MGHVYRGEIMNRFRSIEEQASEPASLEDFLETLRELQEELRAPDNGWENVSLGRYLEAVEAWLTTAAPRVEGVPSWRLFAMALLAARYYE